MNFYVYDTKIGKIGIGEEDGYITNVYLIPSKFPKHANLTETEVIKKAKDQLMKYLSGELQTFDLPLKPKGTPFQKNVWNALCEIPYASTASYKDVACSIDNPQACRAVGNANNKNPIPIFIPCHRVIGVNGGLVGYAGGLEMKKQLLEIEKAQ